MIPKLFIASSCNTLYTFSCVIRVYFYVVCVHFLRLPYISIRIHFFSRKFQYDSSWMTFSLEIHATKHDNIVKGANNDGMHLTGLTWIQIDFTPIAQLHIIFRIEARRHDNFYGDNCINMYKLNALVRRMDIKSWIKWVHSLQKLWMMCP